MKYKLKDICQISSKTVNPQNNKEKIYNLYSLPAFDNNKHFETVKGNSINSNKIIIKGKLILFNKLNVKFKRIWKVDIKNENSICSTEFIPIKVNEKYVDIDYLYYYLLLNTFNNNLIKDSTGTSNSHQRISKDLFLDKEIIIPSMDKQKKIVFLLKLLDMKIELNNHINNNLLVA